MDHGRSKPCLLWHDRMARWSTFHPRALPRVLPLVVGANGSMAAVPQSMKICTPGKAGMVGWRPLGGKPWRTSLPQQMLHGRYGIVQFVLPPCSAPWACGCVLVPHAHAHRRLAKFADCSHTTTARHPPKGPNAVQGPVGRLQPHPMQRSRVLEVVRPVAVAPCAVNGSAARGSTSISQLPFQIYLAHSIFSAPSGKCW
jgi:hypothetical protein